MSPTTHQPPATVPFVDLTRQHEPIADELRAAFERVLEASSFILGEEVERFEHEFAIACGTRHCVGVASGTTALTIALKAAGIGPGDEVIVPAHTFVATGLGVVHAGAQPVCADVQPGTGLLDPDAAAAVIGPRTAAIMAVHLYGQTCEMTRLQELASRHGLLLFEDAAQAHGASFRGRPAGSLGVAAAFSFYPSKNLGGLGDGGAICTSDESVAERARQLRNLGRPPGDGRAGDGGAGNGKAGGRAGSGIAGDMLHTEPGYNERLDGLQAALLRAKLPHLQTWNAARRAAAARYREGLDGVGLLEERPKSPCVYHVFPILVEGREACGESLRGQGVTTSVHYPVALPDQPALAGITAGEVPAARDWAARELSLPIFPGVSDEELDAVIEAVNATAIEVGGRCESAS